MAAQVYLLNANVFIEAARRYYAFDLAPGFWQSLIQHAASGRVRSIDWVKDELDRSNDLLKEWVNENLKGAFINTGEQETLEAYGRVINWVQGQEQFRDEARDDFASGADGWLVACACAKGYTVVTHEVLAPEVRKRVPIPNVCKAFDVRCVDTFAMLRALGVRFTMA